jgi:hypothetical protein
MEEWERELRRQALWEDLFYKICLIFIVFSTKIRFSSINSLMDQFIWPHLFFSQHSYNLFYNHNN